MWKHVLRIPVAALACLVLAGCGGLHLWPYVDLEANCYISEHTPSVRICFPDEFRNAEARDAAAKPPRIEEDLRAFVGDQGEVFTYRGGEGRREAAVSVQVESLSPQSGYYWVSESYHPRDSVLLKEQRRLGKYLFNGALLLHYRRVPVGDSPDPVLSQVFSESNFLIYRLVVIFSSGTTALAITYAESLTDEEYASYRSKGADSPCLEGFRERFESAFTVE